MSDQDDQAALLFLKKPFKQHLQSASAEMKKACRASRRQTTAQELFARWPNLRESSQRLTSLLTLHWPDPRKQGESLLVNCLAKGLSDAEEVIQTDNDDIAEQIAFICRISEELLQCLGMTLMIKYKSGWSAYDPNTDGYLDDIMKSSVSEELTWVNKPHDAFSSPQSKLLCASRVFTMNELKLAGLLE
jgi:hypothetical protein